MSANVRMRVYYNGRNYELSWTGEIRTGIAGLERNKAELFDHIDVVVQKVKAAIEVTD